MHYKKWSCLGFVGKCDKGFREGAVRIVAETGKSIAWVARDVGVGEGTLGDWVGRGRIGRGEAEGLTFDDRAGAGRSAG